MWLMTNHPFGFMRHSCGYRMGNAFGCEENWLNAFGCEENWLNAFVCEYWLNAYGFWYGSGVGAGFWYDWFRSTLTRMKALQHLANIMLKTTTFPEDSVVLVSGKTGRDPQIGDCKIKCEQFRGAEQDQKLRCKQQCEQQYQEKQGQRQGGRGGFGGGG
ncbi:hypothetical protein Tco_0432229 [Tanacetum coccineum]